MRKTKNRLIWDDCTPTMNRRPTTYKDIDEDIHVEDFDDADELLNRLCEIAGEDWEEPRYYGEWKHNNTLKEQIEDILDILSDPGDGSPNIIYCKANGKVLQDCWYEDCEELDMDTCTEHDVKICCKNSLAEQEAETERMLAEMGLEIRNGQIVPKK